MRPQVSARILKGVLMSVRDKIRARLDGSAELQFAEMRSRAASKSAVIGWKKRHEELAKKRAALADKKARAVAEGIAETKRAAREARIMASFDRTLRTAERCHCGVCHVCRHRAAMRRAREATRFYDVRELSPELTRLFPNFAEELSSMLRYPIRKRKAGAI